MGEPLKTLNPFYAHINQHWPKEYVSHPIMSSEEYDSTVTELVKYRELKDNAPTIYRRQKAESLYRELKNKFINANFRFIIHIASRYSSRIDPSRYDDLISESIIGFEKAVDRVEPNQGKITTYAEWWIKQGISRNILRNGLLYVPQYIYEKGEAPSYNVVYLDAIDPISEHPIELTDHKPGVEDMIEQVQISETVTQYLEFLPSKEREILCLRYGIGYSEPLTLDQIGERFHVTRERIRQIEKKALSELRKIMQIQSPIEVKRMPTGIYNRGDSKKWEDYPLRRCFSPEGRKVGCEICGKAIEYQQEYYDRSNTRSAHINCVKDNPDLPKNWGELKPLAEGPKSVSINKVNESISPMNDLPMSEENLRRLFASDIAIKVIEDLVNAGHMKYLNPTDIFGAIRSVQGSVSEYLLNTEKN